MYFLKILESEDREVITAIVVCNSATSCLVESRFLFIEAIIYSFCFSNSLESSLLESSVTYLDCKAANACRLASVELTQLEYTKYAKNKPR